MMYTNIAYTYTCTHKRSLDTSKINGIITPRYLFYEVEALCIVHPLNVSPVYALPEQNIFEEKVFEHLHCNSKGILVPYTYTCFFFFRD